MARPDEVDVTKLTDEEIDALPAEALRRALRSVLRAPGMGAMHKNHNSHSNISERAVGEGTVVP